MGDIVFLELDDVLDFHKTQIERLGGAEGVIEIERVKAAIAKPKQTFGGEYLYDDLFLKAVAYLSSIIMNHPFVDGNKRTGTHSAVTFLYLNGYEIEENYDGELAEAVYDYEEGKKDEEDLADFLADRACPIE